MSTYTKATKWAWAFKPQCYLTARECDNNLYELEFSGQWRKRDNLEERKKALKSNFTAAASPPPPQPVFFTDILRRFWAYLMINLPLQLPQVS